MREVGTNLWVSSLEEALEWASVVDCVIDCLDEHRPTGKTNHAWTPADLDRVVEAALKTKGDVLVHCQSGKSRSPCAAAAILLARGEAQTPQEAMKKTGVEGRRMNSHSIKGLKEWWEQRNQHPLFR
jgi:protein-tyrosine phosphatase|tara:strand:- start:1653 stop:2033 length:381 start_codon:yes stop_codon:yes gene_type:complete